MSTNPNGNRTAHMPNFMCFDGLSPSVARELFDARFKKTEQRVQNKLSKFHGSEEQLSKLGNLFDGNFPVGSPLMSQATMVKRAVRCTCDGLRQIAVALGTYSLGAQVFVFHAVKRDDLVFEADFGECLKAIEPQIKRDYDHAFGAFNFLVVDDVLAFSVMVVGLTGRRQGTSADRRRASRVPNRDPDIILKGLTSDDFGWLTTQLYDPQGLYDRSPLASGKRKATVDDLRLELVCQLTRASLGLDRAIFGAGALGKKLVACVRRELVAHGRSIDFASIAPLRKEGVATFLASLPVDPNGNTFVLPDIKML